MLYKRKRKMRKISVLLLLVLMFITFYLGIRIVEMKKLIIDLDKKIEKLDKENKNLKLTIENKMSSEAVRNILDEMEGEDVQTDDVIIINKKKGDS